MKKILLSIFLAVSMILTNISVIAEEGANTEYQEAVDMLSILNIISVVEDNDDFSAQAYVTREEFCVYLVRAFKLNVIGNANQIFSDVPSDSGLACYVNALNERGVVSGYGGAFRPKDVITYNEAIKMLVSILNYDYASEIGGYPTGYQRIASSLGITENVYTVDQLTKGAAAQLIYNALMAPYMEVAGIKGTEITFKSNSDKSAFTELYNIYEGEGIVMANSTASFTSGTDTMKIDEVLINDVIYNAGKSNVRKLLGHYVEFLYLEIDDEKFEIVKVLEDKGEELIVSSNQIIEFDNNTYRYEDADGKTKKAKLNDDFLIMYNSVYPITNFDAGMMTPDMGRITLVKSGKGTGYSAVIIENYENYIVSGIDEQREILYFNDKTNLNLKGYEYTIFDASGKEIEVSAIKEWNVVSVLASSDNKKITLFMSDEAVEGKTSRIQNDRNPTVVINSTEYFVDSKVISQIEFGKIGKFYLDYNGNIAGIKETYSSGLRYAYFIKASIDYEYDPESDGRVAVKLLDEDGTLKKYYVAEKVRINDVLYKENPEAVVYNGLSLNVKILKYQLNEEGEINTFYVYDGSSDKYIRELMSGSSYWNTKQRSFDGKVTIESGAPVFVAPEGAEVEDYQVVGLSSFANDRKAIAKVYTMGDNVYGEVVLRDAVNTSYERQVAIVKEITRDIDEYEDIRTKMSVMFNGSTQEYILEDEDVLGDVEEGDVVKLSLNHNKEVQAILHLYDLSENRFMKSTNPYEPQSGAGFRSENRSYYGYAYDLTDGLLRYCKTLPSGDSVPDTENALVSAFRIYVVDGPDIYLGSEKDIKDYTSAGNNCSKIIVCTQWADPEDIVIIK